MRFPLNDRVKLRLQKATLRLKNAASPVMNRVRPLLKKTADPQRTWPTYLFGGRIRTSTVVLMLTFVVVWWGYETYQPPEQPKPSPAPNRQVVPPGFVPDPNYTWVPRTRVQAPESTPRYTPPTTTTTTTTTTPPPFVLPPPFGPQTPSSTPPPGASSTTQPPPAPPFPGFALPPPFGPPPPPPPAPGQSPTPPPAPPPG